MKWILKQLKALWTLILNGLKNLGTGITKQFKSLWIGICSLVTSCWKGIITRSQKRWFYFCLGLILAAFFAITLKIEWAWGPVGIIAFVIEFVRNGFKNKFDLKNFISMLIGGIIVFIFQLLG